jgi:catechol 2,3-dioxygenase-like lactoylglutathione lyase family enzyme
MPTFSQIKETCLYVQNLDATEAFYHGLLDLPVIHRSEERHVLFRVGSSVLLCFIAAATEAEETLPPHFAEGKQHLAFQCAPEEYSAWKAKLQGAGIAITHEQVWPGGYESCYFEDPDGHVLEVVPAGVWEA